MSLVMNGVIIPEDTAGAFMFNGVDVTQAFMNGVEVFKQSLFSATWSGGDSLVTMQTQIGVNTSGSLFRLQSAYWSSTEYGNWVSVSDQGLFQGDSVAPHGQTLFTGDGTRFYYGVDDADSTFAFSPSAGFTGVSGSSLTLTFETSGGLIRAAYSTSRGAWLSLT
jgi:hypothetical protein